MGNSCTSVFPNTRTWEQQDLNKTMKQRKKVRRDVQRTADTKKRSPGQSLNLVQSRQLLTTVRLEVPPPQSKVLYSTKIADKHQ